MRVFIILASIALAHGAKLERTYLPPSNARTAGGSGNFLQTPLSRNNYQNSGFAQTPNRFPQTGNEYTQNGNQFAQNGNDFIQNGNGNYEAQGAFAKNAEFNNVNNFGNFEARPERAQAALERNAAILRQDNSNDGEKYAYAYETENGIYAEENGVATNGVEAQGGYSYTGDDGQVYSIRYTADQNGFVPQGDHIPTPPPGPEEILKALEQNARDEAAGIYDDGSYNEGKYSDNIQQNYQQNNQQNNQQSAFNGNDEDTIATNAAFSRNYPSSADTPLSTGAATSSFNGNRASNVEKAYLPPFATRQNGFGRRQKFDSRNGYRY